MSLDHIRETILADARSEAERIVATAREHNQQRLEAVREALEAESRPSTSCASRPTGRSSCAGPSTTWPC